MAVKHRSNPTRTLKMSNLFHNWHHLLSSMIGIILASSLIQVTIIAIALCRRDQFNDSPLVSHWDATEKRGWTSAHTELADFVMTSAFQPKAISYTNDSIPRWLRLRPEHLRVELVGAYAFGWPFRVSSYEFAEHNDLIDIQCGIIVQKWMHQGRSPYAIPIRILWSGFAVNTVVCGIAVVMLRLTFTLLISRRFGPAQCRHCGYDVRGVFDPTCPECGNGLDPGFWSGVKEKNRG